MRAVRPLFLGAAAVSALVITMPANAAPVYLSCNYNSDGKTWDYELTIKPEAETGLVSVVYRGEQYKASQFITSSKYQLKYIKSPGRYRTEYTLSVDRGNGVFTKKVYAPVVDDGFSKQGTCRKSQPAKVLF